MKITFNVIQISGIIWSKICVGCRLTKVVEYFIIEFSSPVVRLGREEYLILFSIINYITNCKYVMFILSLMMILIVRSIELS